MPLAHAQHNLSGHGALCHGALGLAGFVTDSQPLRTVLVVDDHAPMRTLCRLNLEAAGFRVVEAADGDEALESVASDPPNLILLDIMMPRVS